MSYKEIFLLFQTVLAKIVSIVHVHPVWIGDVAIKQRKHGTVVSTCDLLTLSGMSLNPINGSYCFIK